MTDKEKQIEKIDDILRSIFGCQFAYKINYGKYGGYGYHEAIATRNIAKELINNIELLLINESKSNNSKVNSNKCIEEIFDEIRDLMNDSYKNATSNCHSDMKYGRIESPQGMINIGFARGVKHLGDRIIKVEKKYIGET